jgi:pimeloyl-ACP methyl ester carboxylesterase
LFFKLGVKPKNIGLEVFDPSIMPLINSKDGTTIAYDKIGKGPSIILVNGALGHRKLHGEKELALMLANNFTVVYYDRRGRGESADTKPYTVEKEIEDIEVLINEAGGKVFLYGTSSGAALALLTVNRLGSQKVMKLSMYEPPYEAYVKKGKSDFVEIKKKINELVDAGKPGDAVALFFESVGTPPDVIQGMRTSPDWKQIENVGATLVYDFEVLGNGGVPQDVAKNISIPTLVIDGAKSFDFVHATADTLSKFITGSRRKTLEDQPHQVSASVVAPVLAEFFAEKN